MAGVARVLCISKRQSPFAAVPAKVLSNAENGGFDFSKPPKFGHDNGLLYDGFFLLPSCGSSICYSVESIPRWGAFFPLVPKKEPMDHGKSHKFIGSASMRLAL